jgi:hypothetical protein
MKMINFFKRIALVLAMVGFSCSVLAAGIPVIDPSAPIKISESSSYSCDGNSTAIDDGKPVHYKNQTVTCRGDNLWADGKALSFMDLTSDFMSKAIKIQEEKKLKGNESPISTVSLNDFTGDNQILIVRDIKKQCDYHVTINKSEEEVEWHGVKQPQYHWNFVVDTKTCGDIVEQVNMQIVPDKKITTLPIKAGSIYYIYPDFDAFLHN